MLFSVGPSSTPTASTRIGEFGGSQTIKLKSIHKHSLEAVGERLHGALGESGAMLLPQTKLNSVVTSKTVRWT